MIKRRSFLRSAIAFGAANAISEVKAFAPDKGRLKMKLGVLSDIHISPRKNTQQWEKALRAFDKWGADGVLVCGDLADFGTIPELELVAETWFKVFPGNRRSDGGEVVNLLHYGDHDCSGGTYRSSGECVRAYPDEEAMKKLIIPFNDRKAAWERCFKEEWAPIVHKKVKGYDFILSHFSKGEPGNYHGDNVPGLEEFMAKQNLDPKKPFFYSQHRILRSTAGGPHVYGQDDGKVRDLLATKYPNCIAFCGHAHLTASEERSVWQGAFACVEVPSLCYCVTLGGRENGSRSGFDFLMSGINNASQGYFVSVYENAVDIRRWSFTWDACLGPDWSIPLSGSSAKYSHERRAAEEPAPEFAPGSKLKVYASTGKARNGKMSDFVTVAFPLSQLVDGIGRANDYEVQLEHCSDDVIRVLSTRRVFPPNYASGYEKNEGPVVCNFRREELPVGELIRFVARPVNSFSARGKALASGWIRYDGKNIPPK